MGRSASYRALLSGLDQDLAASVGDRIEALVALSSRVGQAADHLDADGPAADDPGADDPGADEVVTGSAWAAVPTSPDGNGARAATTRTIGPASIGPGLGGGGGGWRLNLAPTPELLARVAALPPVRDVPAVDVAEESVQDRRFNLRRLLMEFRRPLLRRSRAGGPGRPGGVGRTGAREGGARRRRGPGLAGRLALASAVYLFVTLADLVVEIGETFVTGRAAQRIMLSLRIRIWAQLQRLSLDYYEREMAGRIMTRMTTDVDQFESLIQNGLLSALVAMVTFVGVGIALVVINPWLGLCTLTVVVPLSIATVLFRRRAARLYDLSRERIGIVNADFQESLCRGARVAGFRARRTDRTAFPHVRPRVPGVEGGGAASGGDLFPLRAVPVWHRRRHRARCGRRPCRPRESCLRAP